MWKKLWWRLPIALGMIILELTLQVIGFVLCAVAPYEGVRGGSNFLVWTWLWVNRIWGNNEDGIDGLGIQGKNANWTAATASWGERRRIWVWSAWRNSVNNLRYTAIGSSPNYGDIGGDSTKRFVFATKGIKFWLCVPLGGGPKWYELWLGWKADRKAGFKSTITSLSKEGA
jgi:hypothetical protein